jgi:hypothetical protein
MGNQSFFFCVWLGKGNLDWVGSFFLLLLFSLMAFSFGFPGD